MNEVTKVHLGRQAFTMSVEAHKALKAYLHDIKRAAGDDGAEVAEEVEARMAELLTERGLGADDVIIQKDVDYLKEQLGAPRDFTDNAEQEDESVAAGGGKNTTNPKRLFRDTEHAMVAGVASGIAAYFNIDVVIIRLLFVLAVVSGGWGIMAYIIMWLVVPEAKTTSERLQMQGKAVTVDSLKDIVSRADVPAATRRARSTAGRFLETASKLALAAIGLSLVLSAVAALFGVMLTCLYLWLHHGVLFQENFFPVGRSELLLTGIVLGVGVIVSLLLLLTGVAMMRRKWQLPGWGVATLLGLLFVGLAAGTVLSADAVPKIRQRYEAANHTVSQSVPAFRDINVVGNRVRFTYQIANTYGVDLHYIGNLDPSQVHMSVQGDTLQIDTREAHHSDCKPLCLFDDYNLQITVHGPTPPQDVVVNGILLQDRLPAGEVEKL